MPSEPVICGQVVVPRHLRPRAGQRAKRDDNLDRHILRPTEKGRFERTAMHMVVYERDKLYEEVWAEPVMKVAERYGVSGVALAKTCRKLNVPLPPRGYWAKIKAGKTL